MDEEKEACCTGPPVSRELVEEVRSLSRLGGEFRVHSGGIYTEVKRKVAQSCLTLW